MHRLAESELRKQALWLVGVLVGMALKEAITHVHAIFVSRFDPLDWLLGLARLLLFFLVTLSFYLGAVRYFGVAFEQSASVTILHRRQLVRDLIFGPIRFVVVCFWGLSIAPVDRSWLLFPALLLMVLLCDVLWYVSTVSDIRRTIRIPVLVNVFTGAWATLAFGSTALAFMCFANEWRVELTQPQGAICETAAYTPVVIASVRELGRLLQGRAGIEEWLREALPPREASSG